MLLRVADLARRPIVVAVVAAGVLGGLIGAAYLWTLRGVTWLIGPEHFAMWTHLLLLVGVGVGVGVLVHWLGAPDDVELLVGNIHVLGGPREVRGLRSLIPASLLCVGVGGPLGPEAPLVTATGTVGSLLAHHRQLSVTEVRAGFTLLPTTLIAAMVSLVLTSGVTVIHSQQRRLGVDTPGASVDTDRSSAPGVGHDLGPAPA